MANCVPLTSAEFVDIIVTQCTISGSDNAMFGNSLSLEESLKLYNDELHHTQSSGPIIITIATKAEAYHTDKQIHK